MGIQPNGSKSRLSWRLVGVAVKKAWTLMDYTMMQFSAVKSALFVLACSRGIKLCKTTLTDKASNANVFQAWRRELAKSIACSMLAGDGFALRGLYLKTCRTLACLIKAGEKVYMSVCLRVFVSEPWMYRGMCVPNPLHAMHKCVFLRLCAESFIAALCSPLWSPKKVFLLPLSLLRSEDLMKTILSLTGL